MIVIYDIETLKKCFTYTGYDFKSDTYYQFVLHSEQFELDGLIKHLKQCTGQIGFNNIDFDYPVIHYILKNYNLWSNNSNDEVIDLIYNEAQRLIEEKNFGDENFLKNYIKPSDYLIRQLDLFKIHHFNNPARRQSLKGLEINMNMDNVMDMPIKHDCETVDVSQIGEILEYNKHDVFATYQFYLKSLDKINLRKQLSKIYNLDLTNASDVKIGEQIFLKLLSDEMGIPKWELNKMRTNRDEVNFKDIILPTIQFKDAKLKALLEDFKNTTITKTKNGFKKSVVVGGIKLDYGQGGIHACIKAGVYESTDETMILDIDVKSFYPNIAVINKFKPEHLGEGFTKIYGDIYKERSQIPKSDPRNAAFKLQLNGAYGKSGDKNSFFKDDKFLLSITVNGQLLLTMLLDSILDTPQMIVLQCNTDGLSIIVPKTEHDKILNICKEWETKTKLELEYQEYSKMVIRDVNSYCAVGTKLKTKGVFKTREDMIADGEWHKDFSFNIVPIALSEYFLTGKPVELTIEEHRNIYDFCGRKKFDKNSWGEEHFVKLDENKNPVKIVNNLQKNVRYYISNKGSSFVKQYTKGTWQFLNLGYQITVFNKFVEKDWSDYDIDYSFYISECYKEINQIETKQLTLF